MNVCISGEIGDAIYCLPTLRELGKQESVNVYMANRSWVRPDWVRRSRSLERLFLAQKYISSFQAHNGERIDLDLTDYRSGGHRAGETIGGKIARWTRVDADFKTPWLEVNPAVITSGNIVVSRGARWRGFSFPWKSLVKALGEWMWFVGTDDEHKAFCGAFGRVERLTCKDMYDVASAVAGSSLFIGNQSSPFACAEGLKRPSVLECCCYAMDCCYGRSNCKYYVDGQLELTFNKVKYSFNSEPVFKSKDDPEFPQKMKVALQKRAALIAEGKPIPRLDAIQSQLD